MGWVKYSRTGVHNRHWKTIKRWVTEFPTSDWRLRLLLSNRLFPDPEGVSTASGGFVFVRVWGQDRGGPWNHFCHQSAVKSASPRHNSGHSLQFGLVGKPAPVVDVNVRPQLQKHHHVSEADQVAHGWKALALLLTLVCHQAFLLTVFKKNSRSKQLNIQKPRHRQKFNISAIF